MIRRKATAFRSSSWPWKITVSELRWKRSETRTHQQKKTHINEETLNKNQYFAIIEQDPSSFTLAKWQGVECEQTGRRGKCESNLFLFGPVLGLSFNVFHILPWFFFAFLVALGMKKLNWPVFAWTSFDSMRQPESQIFSQKLQDLWCSTKFHKCFFTQYFCFFCILAAVFLFIVFSFGLVAFVVVQEKSRRDALLEQQ